MVNAICRRVLTSRASVNQNPASDSITVFSPVVTNLLRNLGMLAFSTIALTQSALETIGERFYDGCGALARDGRGQVYIGGTSARI